MPKAGLIPKELAELVTKLRKEDGYSRVAIAVAFLSASFALIAVLFVHVLPKLLTKKHPSREDVAEILEALAAKIEKDNINE